MQLVDDPEAVMCLQVAPAMNTFMWESSFTDEHINKLENQLGVQVIHPISKALACGDVGTGAMAEPKLIAAQVAAALLHAEAVRFMCDQTASRQT